MDVDADEEPEIPVSRRRIGEVDIGEQARKRLARCNDSSLVSKSLRRVLDKDEGGSTQDLALKLLFATRFFLTGSDKTPFRADARNGSTASDTAVLRSNSRTRPKGPSQTVTSTTAAPSETRSPASVAKPLAERSTAKISQPENAETSVANRELEERSNGTVAPTAEVAGDAGVRNIPGTERLLDGGASTLSDSGVASRAASTVSSSVPPRRNSSGATVILGNHSATAPASSATQSILDQKSCNFDGCSKNRRGSSWFCIQHGGGKRCQFINCTSAARGSTSFCVAHGGGRRCSVENCHKSAVGRTSLCIAHGGGKRCAFPDCSHSAEGATNFCIRHGGGKRCMTPGCNKSAISRTSYCVACGGGKRCTIPGCFKGAVGSTQLCKAHGGGRRCTHPSGCTKSAQGASFLCIIHGGGRRCTFPGCSKSAVGPTATFCRVHQSEPSNTEG